MLLWSNRSSVSIRWIAHAYKAGYLTLFCYLLFMTSSKNKTSSTISPSMTQSDCYDDSYKSEHVTAFQKKIPNTACRFINTGNICKYNLTITTRLQLQKYVFSCCQTTVMQSCVASLYIILTKLYQIFKLALQGINLKKIHIWNQHKNTDIEKDEILHHKSCLPLNLHHCSGGLTCCLNGHYKTPLAAIIKVWGMQDPTDGCHVELR